MGTDRFIVPNVEEAMDQDEDVAGGRSSGNSIFSSPVSRQSAAGPGVLFTTHAGR